MQDSPIRSFIANIPTSLQNNLPHRQTWLGELVKRFVDILASVFGLIILSPLFILVSIRIKRDSAGPVFYRGLRIGRDSRQFHILKFRTMYERPESYKGPRVTAQDDPRVTATGRWLRSTKLNELPQLWNVLVGEMSLVGPRPEDPELVESWSSDVKKEVLSVRPGITSPASVLFRDEEAMLQSGHLMDTYLEAILPSKLRLDQLYVRHRSFLLDIDILFWTFLVLLPKFGSKGPQPQEVRLFIGPFYRLVRHYVSWFMIDVFVVFTAIGLVGFFWRSLGPLNIGWYKAIGIALGFAVLYSCVGAIMGVNRISWSQAGLLDALDLLPAVGLGALIALLINYLWTSQPLLPAGLILLSTLLALGGFVFVRYRSRLIHGLLARFLQLRGSAMQAQERVLIVGGGETGQFMAWWLQNGRNATGLHIIGYVDDDLYKQNTRIRGVTVLGRREDIPELVAQHDVGIILFAIHNIPAEERKELLDICLASPARVVSVPDILGNLQEAAFSRGVTGEIPTRPVNPPPVSSNTNGSWIQAELVETWLGELEELSEAENMGVVRNHIESLQAEIIQNARSLPDDQC